MCATTLTLTQPDDTPLTGFADCHHHIVSQLRTLGELPALLEPAARARRVAEDTLRFFRKNMFDHHCDEEKELFPAVLAAAERGAERETVRKLVHMLTMDHRELEAMWIALEPQLAKVAKGQPVDVDVAAVRELVLEYTAHARHEEEEFLPLCRKILGRDSPGMAELGLSLHMRHTFRDYRRGISGS